jgi:hypothetical protein
LILNTQHKRMNVLTITLLFIKLLISLQLSSAQHKQPFHQITGHHNYGLNGREEVANIEELPEEKGIRVPIISDIQNILKPTKPSYETQKQEQRPVPPKQPYRPMRPPSVTGPKPIVSVDDFDDNSFAAKPSHIFRPNPSDEDLDSHWDKGKKRPSNVWPNPVPDDKPADIPDPYESESDFPYNDGVPPNQPTNHGREPNTIQEWMNENRPVSQQKPPRVPPIEAKAPNKPIEPHPAPWDYPNPDLQKPVVLPQKPDSRPQPIKPSFQPAPWEKPKPVDDEDDNQWWDSNPTTPKPKPPYDSPYNEWDTDDDTVNPDQHKFKPKPQKPLPAPEWWDEKPSRPEPEPEYEPPPPSFPHKPSKPEIPSTGWTGNPNLPVWWNDKPSRPESEPEPEDDNNGWGGNVFGENTGNGIGGVGDTNGIGGAMVGNGSGHYAF